jgi:hypothetical protein
MCQHILVKLPTVKFHEYPLTGLRVVACGHTGKQTDMAKLLGAFCSFPLRRSQKLQKSITLTILYSPQFSLYQLAIVENELLIPAALTRDCLGQRFPNWWVAKSF